jgi:hypothetical protein
MFQTVLHLAPQPLGLGPLACFAQRPLVLALLGLAQLDLLAAHQLGLLRQLRAAVRKMMGV